MTLLRLVVGCLVLLLAAAERLLACPFCPALGPTLAQRRAEAEVVALGEVLSSRDGRAMFRVHQVLRGKPPAAEAAGTRPPTEPAPLELETEERFRPGDLVLLLADRQPPGGEQPEVRWSFVGVNEASLAYLAGAPHVRQPAPKRLRYFARWLEHAEPLVAQDAYAEFAHAPYDQVVEVADALSPARLRAWIADPQVPPERKGFYGLALGLAGDEAEQVANRRFLEERIFTPADDFRAGFDGLLAGYLLLSGTAGLQRVEEAYLANTRSADGDVRHVLSALRFYHEYGRAIPSPRLCRAVRHLLARPEFAAQAATELARWEDWDSLEQVAALYQPEAPLALRQAVVGYLLVCPRPGAQEHLARLRQLDPEGVAAVERRLELLGGLERRE